MLALDALNRPLACRPSGASSVIAASSPQGGYALQMYDGTSRSSTSYYQDAILHVNLAGQHGVVLDYYVKEYSGTLSSASVSVSVNNGATWVSLASIPGTPVWQHFAVGLDALNLTYSGDVQFRFEHSSNYAGGFLWDNIRVRTNATVNNAPTLSSVATLAGGTEDQPVRITYDMLAGAADEADANGDALGLRVESVASGTLTKAGMLVVPGVTILNAGEELIWTPSAEANGTLNAFSVRAWDGDLASGEAVMVKVSVTGVPYTAGSYPYQAIDLIPNAAGVTTLVDGVDDGFAPVPLGSNTFRFYGVTYSGANQLYVSSNGLITFAFGNSANANADLTSSPSQAGIAVLWDDWLTTGANDAVLYQFQDMTGDGIPDRLVIEWHRVRHYSTPSSGDASFQAILQLNTAPRSSVIVLNYPDLDVGNATYNNGGSATVGIKGSGTQGSLLVSSNSGSNPLVQSGKAIRITKSTDMTPPAPPIITRISDDTGASVSDGITSDRTLILAGTAEPDSIITLSRGGIGVIGNATSDASGNWTFDYTGTVLPGGPCTFTATATDATWNTSASSSPFAVFVDTTPPTDITLAGGSVAEKQPVGSIVGALAGTDPDPGQSASLRFSLVPGYGDNASFTISGNQLKTAAIFDYETRKTYSILVRTTDASGLTFDKAFTINVTNIREATVAGRKLFYNQSYFDGNNAAANVADDNAIATDKRALLPGQTSPASPAL